MTRIIAGAASGCTLRVPPHDTRPTSERVREAVFSTLTAFNVLADSHVLDLFAGSGALGLEAASRGAASVDLIDAAAPAIKCCERNARELNKMLPKPVSVTTHRADVTRWISGTAGTAAWDLVFIDPPYAFAATELTQLLEQLHPRLAPDAMVVVERSSRDAPLAWPSGYEPAKRKQYGETTVWYGWKDAA